MSDDEQVGMDRMDVSVQLMEDVLEKLKLLNYSKMKKYTPCTRTTFAFQDERNASFQFKFLMELCSFLVAECKAEFSLDKYDDPNTSVNKLLLVLKSVDIEVDFPASKIKQGYGDAVCITLQKLCNKALKENGFLWAKPEYPKEEFADEAEVDEEADLENNVLDEEPIQEEEEMLYSEPVKAVGGTEMEDSMNQIIVATVDPLAWKAELERVGPKLKAKGKPDTGKEWRAHIEQNQKHKKTIKSIFPGTTGQLQVIGKELKDSLEKMSSKERYINSQYENLRQEYHEIKDKLQATTEQYQTTSDTVGSMSNEYAEINEKLSDIKTTMDSRGSSMTDTSPLVKIKSALQALKTEINTFELRIGIVSHTLLNAKSKSSFGKSDSMNDPEYDGSDDELY